MNKVHRHYTTTTLLQAFFFQYQVGVGGVKLNFAVALRLAPLWQMLKLQGNKST